MKKEISFTLFCVTVVLLTSFDPRVGLADIVFFCIYSINKEDKK